MRTNKEELEKNKREIKQYLKLEEEFWKQKSGMQWFKEGYRNTKFLHAYVKGRRRTLTIDKIQTKLGVTSQTTQSNVEEAVKVFKN